MCVALCFKNLGDWRTKVTQNRNRKFGSATGMANLRARTNMKLFHAQKRKLNKKYSHMYKCVKEEEKLVTDSTNSAIHKVNSVKS